ncbi:MAG: hypothetical protein IJT96_00250 [Lachnospiraceae bacterium]|nr:hypothetical protein [Lachnospiraceae bacterium]
MKNKVLALLLVLSLVGTSLAGCGVSSMLKGDESDETVVEKNDDNEEDETEAEDESEEEEESTASGTLSLFSEDGGKSLAESSDDSDNNDDDSADDAEDINELSDEEAKELAEFLSTTDNPSITDWEFIGAALWGGNDNLMEYFGNPDATVIHNPLLVEGDWKCVTCPIPNEYSSESSYLGTANIHSLNDNVSFTWDMWLSMEGTFEGNGEEITDGSPVKFTGTWNEDKKGFYVENDYMMVEFTKFIYLDNTMYAIGKDMYISGEQEYVVLIRPHSRMEIIDTSDWRYATNNNTSDSSDSNDTSQSEQPQSNSPEQSGGQTTESSGGSTKLSNAEIVERAKKKSGAPIAELDSVDPDGTLNIHLYEDNGVNQATWDWYYINPDTLTGHNVVGDVIDLN